MGESDFAALARSGSAKIRKGREGGCLYAPEPISLGKFGAWPILRGGSTGVADERRRCEDRVSQAEKTLSASVSRRGGPHLVARGRLGRRNALSRRNLELSGAIRR